MNKHPPPWYQQAHETLILHHRRPAAAAGGPARRPAAQHPFLHRGRHELRLDRSLRGPIKDLTPHLDRLAAEGLRFEHAYSTVAVCQPVRQTMQTGLYPHRSGSMGFFPIKPEVRTLNQQLHDAGYLISMFGKGKHHQPAEKFCVDVADDTLSRSPSKLAEATRKVLRMAREQKRPFFHNVNCYDPHRPFIGISGPNDLAEGEPPSRWIKPEEITEVPGFLENLPEVRRELAGYYTNVRRL